jgi:hypothetical protein
MKLEIRELFRKFKYGAAILVIVAFAACGGGSPNDPDAGVQCTLDSQCASGFLCQNNSCIRATCNVDSDCAGSGQVCINGACFSPLTQINTNSFQDCEYFGSKAGCNAAAITAIQGDDNVTSTDIQTAQHFMQVAEAYAFLSDAALANISNVRGSGVGMAIIGTGANTVAGELDSINETNLGFAKVGAALNNQLIAGDGNFEIKNNSNWYTNDDDQDPNNDSSVTYGSFCAGSNCQDEIVLREFASHIYATGDGSTDFYVDEDILKVGNNDLAQGTALVAIIAGNDDATEGEGIASGATVNTYKTELIYEKDSFLNNTVAGSSGTSSGFNSPPIVQGRFGSSDNDPADFSSTIQDNQQFLDAISAAKTSSEVILFNANNLHDTASTLHTHRNISFVNPGVSGLVTSFNVAARTLLGVQSADVLTSIRNLVNDSNEIFVAPVANQDLNDILRKTPIVSDSRNYDTFLKVADVVVNSVTYCNNNTDASGSGVCDNDADNDSVGDRFLNASGQDEYGVRAIDQVDIGAFKNGFDCSAIDSAHCLIAPTNVHSMNSSGSYVNTGFDNEYTGSAYVAAIITSIKGAYPSMSNVDIVNKLVATATDPSLIDDCNVVTGNCGSGMINYYQFLKPAFDVSTGAAVASVSGASLSVRDSGFVTSSAFGSSVSTGSLGVLSKSVFYDDYNFTYKTFLESRIASEYIVSKISLSNVLDERVDTKSEDLEFKQLGFRVSSVKENDRMKGKMKISHEMETEVLVTNYEFNQNLFGFLDLRVVHDGSYTHAYEENKSKGIIANGRNYMSLMQSSMDFYRVRANISGNLFLSTRFISSENESNILSSLNYKIKDGELEVSYGHLAENDGFLGAKTSGAFGNDNSAETNYINLQFMKEFKGLNFYANFSYGNTKVNLDKRSIISDISDIKSRELSINVSKKVRNSEFGIGYQEPLRVVDGNFNLSVSTGRYSDGSYAIESDTVNFSPDGKERDYELFFNQEISDDSDISLNVIYVADEGNIEGRVSKGFLFKFSKRF